MDDLLLRSRLPRSITCYANPVMLILKSGGRRNHPARECAFFCSVDSTQSIETVSKTVSRRVSAVGTRMRVRVPGVSDSMYRRTILSRYCRDTLDTYLSVSPYSNARSSLAGPSNARSRPDILEAD